MEQLQYGPVYIIGGKYAGRMGYYDNDDSNSKGESVAVVYFGRPCSSKYALIKFEHLSQKSYEEKPTKSNESFEILDVEQAADFLNMQISRIRYEVFHKSIPFFKVGKSIRFEKNLLIKWLNTKKVSANGTKTI